MKGAKLLRGALLIAAISLCVIRPVIAEGCPKNIDLACGLKDGVRKTYSNTCFAHEDGATDVTAGACGSSLPRVATPCALVCMGPNQVLDAKACKCVTH